MGALEAERKGLIGGAWNRCVRFRILDFYRRETGYRLKVRPTFVQLMDTHHPVTSSVAEGVGEVAESTRPFVNKKLSNKLTNRQNTVHELLLSGMGAVKISIQLGVSRKTTNAHIQAIYRHFNVHCAIELLGIEIKRLREKENGK